MLRGQGAALYGPRACDKNMMTAIQALYRDDLDHGRAIRLWLYVVAALIFAMGVIPNAGTRHAQQLLMAIAALSAASPLRACGPA